MTESARAAVFSEVGQPLDIQEFELPRDLEPGAALCKVRLSTICGSDLHTIGGRRQEPTPLILGHEILGEIVELGEGLDRDAAGLPLRPGDRVTWTIMAFCGDCFYCNRGLPQKCEHLRKYGHSRCTQSPGLTGGYAEFVCLWPGTAVFRVPDALPDEVAAPANCALATVVNGVETIGLVQGETVLIQGAGLLGLNLVALAKEAGAAKMFVTDVSAARLQMATRFGADVCINIGDTSSGDVVGGIRDESGGYGVDVAFEVCGATVAIGQGVEALRIGGRYLIAGLVMPDTDLGIEGNQVTRKCLTIKGIHNYAPVHLERGLAHLAAHHERYPFAELVGATYPLDDIGEAVEAAFTGESIRVAVTPVD